MTEPATNYTPVDLQERFQTQARRVWLSTLAVVAIWMASIVAPTLLPGISAPIYTFFSYICHQMPERSLYLAGGQMAVCSRCFGVYFGLLVGVLVYPAWRSLDETEPIPRVWLFLSLIPITIDWALTVFGIWENTHVSRVVTGVILGFACSTYIIPALVEIIRNITSSRRPRTQ
jgi:uncharacterized membrane protein